MRLYIHQIEQHAQEKKPTTFHFGRTINGAWFWKTQADAERALCIWQSSSVQQAIGVPAAWSAFRIEQRPNGGFVISCESPIKSCLKPSTMMKDSTHVVEPSPHRISWYPNPFSSEEEKL